LKKIAVLTSLAVSSVLFIAGCAGSNQPEAQPTSEPTASKQSVAEPSDYSTGAATPSPTPTPTGLQPNDDILEITDGLKKVTLTFSGSATVMELNGPKTRELPTKLEYKAKQAILDSRLSRVPQLSVADVQCTADDLAIKISIAKGTSAYRPCEYASNYQSDPLIVAAHEVLEEVY
jgi:hypothetical protein